MKSIEVWAAHARLLSFKLLRLMVDGPEAVGIVHEHGQCLANNNEYSPLFSFLLHAAGEQEEKRTPTAGPTSAVWER